MKNQLKYFTLVIVSIFSFNSQIFAQSNGCAGAIDLGAPGTSCSTTAVSVPGGFTDSGVISGTCNNGQIRDDGWFVFTANATYTAIDVSNTTRDIAVVIWDECGGNEIDCDEQAAVTTVSLGITTIIGEDYYIQIHRRSGNAGAGLVGDICIYSPPTNNDCSNATALPCGTTSLAGTTVGSSNIANGTGCSMGDYGVWYTFVGDGQNTTIDCSATSGWDHEMSVASGACGALTNVTCQDGAFTDGTESFTFISTLGTTYYVYISYWSNGGTNTGDFEISRSCTVPPTPPLNDDCTGAYPITINPDFSCSSTTSGTVEAATPSSQSAASCAGTEDTDVWFSFVATGTTHTIDLLNIAGSGTDMYHSVWEGACPALNLVAGSCSDPNSSTVTGLTIGNTYYIRVYEYYTGPENTTFDVCVGTPPPPPANDDCSGAYPITVNPDFMCGSTTAGTVSSATPSSQDATSCAGTEDTDVWFSFVATNGVHSVDLLNITGTGTDMYHSVWQGTCPTLTLVAGTCSDPNSSILVGLSIGTTYYVRVYEYYSGPENTNFDICIGTPPPPPANDDCTGAVSLTVNPGLACVDSETGSVASATASSQDATACGGTENDDVWYSFVATSTDHVVALSNIFGSTTDLYHSVWEGACPTLNLVAGTCSDGDAQNLTGLTIGNTYYVRVNSWSSASGATTTFDICITTPEPPPPCDGSLPEPDDACANATSINTFDGYCGTSLASYTVDANGAFCGSLDNNSWLQFVASETTVQITWWITGGASCISGVQFEAYSGTCGSLTAITSSCINPTGSAGSNGTFSFSGLTIGNTYYIMIDGYAGDVCDYTWQAQSGILPIDLVNLKGTVLTRKNLLTWDTESETNNDYFEIQKSTDGINFSTIGKVQGAGNSSNVLSYEFSDYEIDTEFSYYRIRQVDFDGEHSYTKTIEVSRVNKTLHAYPNPTNGNLSFDYYDMRSDTYTVRYINSLGQFSQETFIISENGESSTFKSELFNNLSNGIYFIEVVNTKGEIIYQDKIIKSDK